MEDLRQRLAEEGVDPLAFDFEGTQRDEVYCLERQVDGWTYYYRERGIKRDAHVFASEDAAHRFFLKRVLRDPTTRLR